MEDNFKNLEDWADKQKQHLEDQKKYLENTKNFFDNLDIPAEEKKKVDEVFSQIDIEDIQKVAKESAMNIINHVKSKM